MLFPTDMQPQITAVLALAQGTSLVTEGVYGANRFKYVDELKRMGAHIQVDGKVAVRSALHELHILNTATDDFGGIFLTCADGLRYFLYSSIIAFVTELTIKPHRFA